MDPHPLRKAHLPAQMQPGHQKSRVCSSRATVVSGLVRRQVKEGFGYIGIALDFYGGWAYHIRDQYTLGSIYSVLRWLLI